MGGIAIFADVSHEDMDADSPRQDGKARTRAWPTLAISVGVLIALLAFVALTGPHKYGRPIS